MPIRVITGKAKGRRLKMVPGADTRPIMDRIKENLFNILDNLMWVRGSRWLDLFAGTGSVGIEALSRGAAHCLFLDADRRAVRTVHENLQITRLGDGAEVRREDAFAFLANEPREQGFEVIYIAPPQYKGMWRRALEAIDARPDWLLPDGLAVVQVDPSEYEALSLEHLALIEQRTYGNTMLCFYERPAPD
jgi:16S rRNA (guanine966-N2)-methyltransferase